MLDPQQLFARLDALGIARHTVEHPPVFTVEEAKALAPFSKHLHIHDSFGRPKDFWTYSLTEDLAFGAGDLHLPLGWGNLPFDRIAAEAVFPAEVVADIELQARFWSELPETIRQTQDFAGRLRSGDRVMSAVG